MLEQLQVPLKSGLGASTLLHPQRPSPASSLTGRQHSRQKAIDTSKRSAAIRFMTRAGGCVATSWLSTAVERALAAIQDAALLLQACHQPGACLDQLQPVSRQAGEGRSIQADPGTGGSGDLLPASRQALESLAFNFSSVWLEARRSIRGSNLLNSMRRLRSSSLK